MDERDKKIHDYEHEKNLAELAKKERDESNKLYAIKLSEKAIFALIALISIGVVSVLIKVALNYTDVFLN